MVFEHGAQATVDRANLPPAQRSQKCLVITRSEAGNHLNSRRGVPPPEAIPTFIEIYQIDLPGFGSLSAEGPTASTEKDTLLLKR